ncbi:MAG: hypothetical protein M1366_04080 [Patescibacteria group bacterium]|nr:hypothetical protein [Patescibacteria group bacterium]
MNKYLLLSCGFVVLLVIVFFSFTLIFSPPKAAAQNYLFGSTGGNFFIKPSGGSNVFQMDSTGHISVATINASNLSSGAFGSNTGGGNYSFSGNVGIGTTGPQTALDVAGQIKVGSAGIKFSDSTTMTTAASSGPWTTNGNNIYNSNSGNVGIGTISPGAKLDVSGNGHFSSTLSTTGISNTAGTLYSNYAGSGDIWLPYSNGYTYLRSPINYITNTIQAENGNWLIPNSGNAYFNQGNVGIGTANPQAKLDVPGGLIQGLNVNAAPILSTQPASRFSAGVGGWYYTGEYISVTVPSGPSRRYLLIFRQLIYSCSGNSSSPNSNNIIYLTLSTSSSSQNNNFFLLLAQNWGGGLWQSVTAQQVVTFAPGTYTYYVWGYSPWISPTVCGIQLANATSDGRLYSDIEFQPL